MKCNDMMAILRNESSKKHMIFINTLYKDRDY